MRKLGASLGTAMVLVALGLASLIAACEDDSVPRPRGHRHAARAPGAGATREGEPDVPTSAWPEDVGDLREAVTRFVSVDACIAELRRRTPAAVAEAVADIAYDSLADDVCRGLAAIKTRSTSGCDALSVQPARRGCRRRLAMLAADPSACPADAVIAGREPVCVAWAMRDPGMCRAAPAAERARCKAVLARRVEDCRSYERGDRERCVAEVRRYASALAGDRNESSARSVRTELEIEIDVLRPGAAPRRVVLDDDVLERGVRLEPRGCAHRVVLADPLRERETSLGLSGSRGEARLVIDVPARAQAPVTIAVGPLTATIEIALEDVGVASSVAGANGNVVLSHLDRARGGILEGAFDATLPLAPGTLRARGTFRTFVRDADALGPRCAAQ